MEILDNITSFLKIHIEIFISIVLFLAFLISRKIALSIIRRHARKNNFTENRVLYTTKFFTVLLALILITFLAIVWNVTFEGLSIYLASIFAVVGIAFFAQWSILSNITASIVLFFNFTVKMGTHITIIDGDNSISGKIVDISLFHIKIQEESGHLVTYPNSLAIQKPIRENQNTE